MSNYTILLFGQPWCPRQLVHLDLFHGGLANRLFVSYYSSRVYVDERKFDQFKDGHPRVVCTKLMGTRLDMNEAITIILQLIWMTTYLCAQFLICVASKNKPYIWLCQENNAFKMCFSSPNIFYERCI